MSNTVQLGIDAFNGSNFVQAYSYFDIALQENYNDSELHFYKGLCSAYMCNLANINTAELLNEYSIAARICRQNGEDVSVMVNYVILAFEFTHQFCDLAYQHRLQFPDLASSYTDFWEIAVKLLNMHITLYQHFTLEDAKQNPTSFKNLINIAKKTSEAIISRAIKCGIYKDGIEFDSHGYAHDKRHTIAPSQTVVNVIGNCKAEIIQLEDILTAAKRGITHEELLREKSEEKEKQAMESRHWTAMSEKRTAKSDFRKVLVTKIIQILFDMVFIVIYVVGLILIIDDEPFFPFVGVPCSIFFIVLLVKHIIRIRDEKEKMKYKLSYDPETRTHIYHG